MSFNGLRVNLQNAAMSPSTCGCVLQSLAPEPPGRVPCEFRPQELTRERLLREGGHRDRERTLADFGAAVRGLDPIQPCSPDTQTTNVLAFCEASRVVVTR